MWNAKWASKDLMFKLWEQIVSKISQETKFYNISIILSLNKNEENHNIVKKKITGFSYINKNK